MALQPAGLMEREGKLGNVVQVEGGLARPHQPGLSVISPTTATTKTTIRGIVACFLTRRSSKRKDANQSQSVSDQKQESVPTPRVARSKAWMEHRKSVADLEKPMDGVGLATGNGEGDMRGVIIKDFATVTNNPPVSESNSCEEPA